MRYEAHHIKFKNPIRAKSLFEAQTAIEKKAGYDPLVPDSFKNYYTASINEYNFIGRHTASYYFSKIHKTWNKIPNSRLSYYSYENVVWPLKFFAQKYLELTGHKAKEDNLLNKFILERTIDQLYPKKK